MAYAKTFQKELVLVLFGSVLYVVALAMQSYVAQALLQFLNDRENIFGIANGYWLVVLMTASSIVAVCTLNFVFFTTSRIGANVRSLTMTLVFDKALRLSSAARQEYTAGEVLTLMSVDAERVFTAVLQSPWHVMGPLAFVVSIVMIGVLLDAYSALAGAAVLVVVMWVTVKQGDRIAHLQRRLLEVIEKRVKVTSEALQGIRVMKFYAWEEPLAQRVEKLRAREVGLLRKFHSFQVINTVMLFLTPTFLSGVTLGLYVLLHSTIDIIEAFTLIAMVNICRTALFQLPQAVSSFCKARISLSRVDAFLASDEFVTNHLSDSTPSNAMAVSPTTQPLISKDYTEDTGSIGRGKISFRDASFRWPVSAQINDLVVVTTAVIESQPGTALETPSSESQPINCKSTLDFKPVTQVDAGLDRASPAS
ncbi:ATP-binding cassette sub-family C member 2 [Phytophthora ramorum]|uniref:ATP-binding cassette sub-family C member 2 n=1 Tax=Phytophthora ramorum TaxID=164328 RepID=UPI0030A21C78|nr:ATP-binding cassette sub-family C member 2 [Phytophthora ramorum]